MAPKKATTTEEKPTSERRASSRSSTVASSSVTATKATDTKKRAAPAPKEVPVSKKGKNAAAPEPAEKKKKEPATAPAEKEAEAAEEKDELAEEEDIKEAEEKKELSVGDLIPKLVLKNEKGEDINLREITKESGVVFFLYPKASTPGCTTQAKTYSAELDSFTSKSYTVYGLSKDTPAAQQKWINKEGLKFSCLCDPKRELIGALGGNKSGGGVVRSHFIFSKGGKLVEADVGVKPKDDTANALMVISSL